MKDFGLVQTNADLGAPRAKSLAVHDLQSLVLERAMQEPDRALFHFLEGDNTVAAQLTPAQLEASARAVAAAVIARGFQGQPVLLLYPPGLDYIVAFYGCIFAGAIPVPAYPPNPARLKQSLPRLEAIVRDAGACLALTSTSVLPLVQGLAAFDPAFAQLQWMSSDDCEPAAPGMAFHGTPGPGDLAFIQYTSGSTAVPKGVMVTHENLLYNADDFDCSVRYREDDIIFSWLPTFHDMGLLIALILPLYKGMPLYLMSPLDFLKTPSRWVKGMSAFRATQSAAPNFAFDLTVRRTPTEVRDTLDLSHWRKVGNAAEPVRRETIENFCAAFASSGFRPETFFIGYGLAEATLKVSGGPLRYLTVDAAALQGGRAVPAETPANGGTRTLVSCGTSVLSTVIAIVDPESLRRCGAGEVGEVWVAGPAVAKGYWNNAEETQHVFDAHTSEQDGPFLRTGDLGFLHQDELYITGRLKDLIILDGTNHYPQDIEWAAESSHPRLHKNCCAAFGIDDGHGERVVIAIEAAVPEPGEDGAALAREIVMEVRRAVSQGNGVSVADVVLVRRGHIPKTSSGKIQRHACRQGYLEGSLDRWPAA
jgi:acyl-CoA synthetase (AMP-forming)/AMP-acid ligase II